MHTHRAHYHGPACFGCYNQGSVSISIRNPLVSGLKHFQMVLDAGKQFVSGVPKKALMWCTFELRLEPSLVLQWSFCDCISDIYMWKNTQLGPLFICFKRREPHKSLGRAERSQKAVDVWIASTASSLRSFPRGWQRCRPAASALCVAPRGCLASSQPLATCGASGHWHASGSFANGVSKRFLFHTANHPSSFKTQLKLTLGLLSARPNKIQCWEGSPAVLRLCPTFQVKPFASRSAEREEFLLPRWKTLFLLSKKTK